MKTPSFFRWAAFVAVALVLAAPAWAGSKGSKAGKGTPQANDADAMYQVQSHMKAVEDKLAILKTDSERPEADRMSAEDRAAALKYARKELSSAQAMLGASKGALTPEHAKDFTQRIAEAKKACAEAGKGGAPKPAAVAK